MTENNADTMDWQKKSHLERSVLNYDHNNFRSGRFSSEILLPEFANRSSRLSGSVEPRPLGSVDAKSLYEPSSMRGATPLDKECLAQIREKLAKYHAESDKAQLSERAPRSSSPVGRRTARPRRRSRISDDGPSSFTITFSSQTREVHEEKNPNWRGPLNPVVRARKFLMRTIGTCQNCRSRKKKCYLTHHALEDLLVDFPDAYCDVRWALRMDEFLQMDTDPNPSERAVGDLRQLSPQRGRGPAQDYKMDMSIRTLTPYSQPLPKRSLEDDSFESDKKRNKNAQWSAPNIETPNPFSAFETLDVLPCRDYFSDPAANLFDMVNSNYYSFTSYPHNPPPNDEQLIFSFAPEIYNFQPYTENPPSTLQTGLYNDNASGRPGMWPQDHLVIEEDETQRASSAFFRNLQIDAATDQMIDIIDGQKPKQRGNQNEFIPKPARGPSYAKAGLEAPSQSDLGSTLLSRPFENPLVQLYEAHGFHRPSPDSPIHYMPPPLVALSCSEIPSKPKSIDGYPLSHPRPPSLSPAAPYARPMSKPPTQFSFFGARRRGRAPRGLSPVNDKIPLLQKESALSSSIESFHDRPAVTSYSLTLPPSDPIPRNAGSSSPTGSTSGQSRAASTNTANTTVSSGSGQRPYGTAGQSQLHAPPTNGTVSSQTAASPPPPPPPSGAALLVGFFKADPAVMTFFEGMLLAGMGCQVAALFRFFRDDAKKGEGRIGDPDFLSLCAGFWIQMAGLYIIVFDVSRFADRYLRLWIQVMTVMSLILSGSALGIYFLYTTVGDSLMFLGGLLQVWTWKMIVFKRRNNDEEPHVSQAPQVVPSIPLTRVRSVTPDPRLQKFRDLVSEPTTKSRIRHPSPLRIVGHDHRTSRL